MFSLVWVLKSMTCRKDTPFCIFTGTFLIQKTWKKSFRIRPFFIPYVWGASEAMNILQVCSVPRKWSAGFLFVVDWNFSGHTSSTTHCLPLSPWLPSQSELPLYQPAPRNALQKRHGFKLCFMIGRVKYHDENYQYATVNIGQAHSGRVWKIKRKRIERRWKR